MKRLETLKKTQQINEKAVPHIAGNQGYPPIYEPSPEQVRDVLIRKRLRQKDALLDQVFY